MYVYSEQRAKIAPVSDVEIIEMFIFDDPFQLFWMAFESLFFLIWGGRDYSMC